ncbi:hypothetical protein [Burkholderia pseudomultivorans]|nr:hypothetical protein [Burkholderia pseudomultivorans]
MVRHFDVRALGGRRAHAGSRASAAGPASVLDADRAALSCIASVTEY